MASPDEHNVLLEPSECLWQVWGLILNVILPLLPSCWSSPLSLDMGYHFLLGSNILLSTVVQSKNNTQLCPSPVATRPCPHVATADRSLGREKKVARRVASRSLQASGCPESEVAVGLGGAPWGIRQALAGAVTPGAPD